jgi:glutaredoxin 3
MQLELYHLKGCPYSAKVRAFINEAGLKSKIIFHEIHAEPQAYDKLMELTGQAQVPCLVIDGKPLLESDEIIKFLSRSVRGGRTAA